MKLKPVHQQTVVVVGATSGIGRAAALRFSQVGARLVLSGRSQSELDELANEITAQGGQAIGVAADVSRFEEMERLASQAVETYGCLDTWVHVAAVMMYATFSQTRPEEFRQMVEVNLMGQVYGAMAALPHLKAGGGGALIHITSVEAVSPIPLQSAYSASKHGVAGFLGVLRSELKHEGWPVSVTNIMPAGMNTPLYDKALTRLGVKPKPVPPVYDPWLVADSIVFAAGHPVRHLVVGDAGKLLYWLQRISPRLADAWLERYAFRLLRTNQPKPDSAPNNLFHHLPGFDTVQGTIDQHTPIIHFNPLSRLQLRPAARLSLLLGLSAAGALALGLRGSQRSRSLPGFWRKRKGR